MSKTKPLFTVATITYNSSKWIRLAIESVLSSTFTDFEFLISDDNSTDSTWEIIGQFDDPKLKAWQNETNLGEYKNRNKVLTESIGRYIIYIDGDDELFPETLDRLSSIISLYPEAGAIWGVKRNEIQMSLLPLQLSPSETMKWIYLANTWIAFEGFAETLFKTDLLKKLGGFPIDLICGDTLMKKQLAIEASILLVPGGFAMWRVSPGQASSKLSENYNGFINNVTIDKRIIEILNKKDLYVDLDKIKKNIDIRNIKLLIKHTFKKGKVKDFIFLFKKLKFSISQFKYVFIKGDYSYRKQLQEEGYILPDK